MTFRPVLEGEWQQLRDALYLRERIQARANQLVQWLHDSFKVHEPRETAALKFEPEADEDIVCKITSAVGRGRIRLDWALVGDELYGVLIVEKLLRGENDEPRWMQVWQLNIPETSAIFVAEPGDGFVLRSNASRQLEFDVFAIGMSILFAIISGPVTR